MPKLTDTQLVILSAAAQRDDRAVPPLPKSLKTRGGATTSVLRSLVKKGLLEEKPGAPGGETWRETEDGRRMILVVTEAGIQALDGGPASRSGKKPAPTKAQAKKPRGRARRKTAVAKPKGKASPPTVRPGTKQALLVDLLKRKRGATIEEIAAATGWQAHSVRGAISGTLKKKLGLAVTSEIVDSRGRVYRITGRGR